MTKIESATNEQLNVLVATRAMGWAQEDGWWFDPKDPVMVRYTVQPLHECDANYWQPSTNIAHAFQVDKPEWAWWSEEHNDSFLEIGLRENKPNGMILTSIEVPLDPANKTAAYCRGRCIAALKACGVTEVE